MAVAQPTVEIEGSWYLYRNGHAIQVIDIDRQGNCKIWQGYDEKMYRMTSGNFTGSGKCSVNGSTITFEWEKSESGKKTYSMETATLSEQKDKFLYGSNTYQKLQ